MTKAVLAATLLLLLGLGREVGANDSGDARPLVAVIGQNEGTEVTDFVVPYGVLSASGVARVVDVSVYPGPLKMMPALTVATRETIASFDAKYPAGAQYVVVPAMHHSDDPNLLAWLRDQSKRGATIVGICDGVLVVAATGLLENRAATGHWYSMSTLQKEYPHTRWVRDRRYVHDEKLMTTTGVSASLPASLELVEQIGGAERAAALAQELGVPGWDATHESGRYQLSARDLATAARNWLSFWRYERIGIPLQSGVDEISLSFTADALGRTYDSTMLTVTENGAPIVSKRGLTILPDQASGTAGIDRIEPAPSSEVLPGQALDRVLGEIAHRQGENTARFVALQLEYPWEGTQIVRRE